MRISVLGAGNGGCAIAADLSLKGHEVTLIKTSHAMHDDNFDYLIKNDGEISIKEDGILQTTSIYKVTRDLSKVYDAEVIIIYIQTNYHEPLIKKLVPLLSENQIVLFNPGYLSTAYVLKHAGNKKINIVEATSSFVDCRMVKPGFVNVGFRNVRNPLGIYPISRKKEVTDTLSRMGYPFAYFSSVVEAALHNPNLIIHTVGGILSIPRVEKTMGDYVMYQEVFTPSVWKILEALDQEKMALLERLGFPRLPYVEAAKFRNTLDDNLDAKESFFRYAMSASRAKGPTAVDTRYINEDVPQGLVMLESLGKSLSILTPITSSLIEISSAALGRDLRAEGRTLERLGMENIRKIIEDQPTTQTSID